MVNWIIIIILVVVGMIALKMTNIKHKIFIVLLIALVLFLYASSSVVNNDNDLDFSSVKGISHASGIYLGWLANGFHNVKGLAGNAIGMDWGSTNDTFINQSASVSSDKTPKTRNRL